MSYEKVKIKLVGSFNTEFQYKNLHYKKKKKRGSELGSFTRMNCIIYKKKCMTK